MKGSLVWNTINCSHEKIDEYAPDYIVLAKYMRVLNPEFVARYPNRVINIHHSFLPHLLGQNLINKPMNAV